MGTPTQYCRSPYGTLTIEQVRRVVLPYTSTITRSSAPLQAVEILKRCPRVEVLVRPRYATSGPIGFEFEADMVPFHTLRRLDWWGNSEAERSGGLNSLGNVLAHAPGLRCVPSARPRALDFSLSQPQGICSSVALWGSARLECSRLSLSSPTW